MAKTFNRMRIDVNEKPNSICINPVQNDTQSRYLDVSLYNNGLPIDLTGEVVRINFKKEDGTTFFNQGEITNAAEGRCQFALTNEVLSEAKTLKAQISIWSGEGEILSTQVFTIYVAESIRNDEEVESTNEFGVLVVLFQEIQNALDLMQKITKDFGEPGEKAEEFEAETFWQMLEVLAQRADTKEMIKEYVNSTVDSGYLHTLDKLLGAKIVCRGTIGTKFTLIRTDGYYPKMTAEITENSKELSNGLYAVIVPVPCGSYSIKIDVGETTMTATVNASGIGQHYTFSYSSYQLLQTFTSNGTFIVPENITTLYISAIGGGGGGGGGGLTHYEDADAYPDRVYGGSGGGGGGAGNAIINKAFTVTPGMSIPITIGSGGTGGEEATRSGETKAENGSSGGATVIGSLVTLEGGGGGKRGSGSYYSAKIYEHPAGGAGGTGSHFGGAGGTGKGGNDTSIGGSGAKGSGSYWGSGGAGMYKASHYLGAPGGGGGGADGDSIFSSKGGNGGRAGGATSYDGTGVNATAASAGSRGGGGGGGGGGTTGEYSTSSRTYYGNASAGAKGGDGVVKIYKGVQVT